MRFSLPLHGKEGKGSKKERISSLHGAAPFTPGGGERQIHGKTASLPTGGNLLLKRRGGPPKGNTERGVHYYCAKKDCFLRKREKTASKGRTSGIS